MDTSNQFPIKQYAIRGLLIVIVIIVAIIIRHLLLGSAEVVKLAPSSRLDGLIAQSMGLSPKGNLYKVGADFTYTTQYFDQNQWVVATISPTGSHAFDGGVDILHNNNGIYQVVLGPSSSYSSAQLQNVPGDVVSYLSTSNAVTISGGTQ